MGMYKYVREIWKKPQEKLGELWRERLIAWRREGATTRCEKPTRIDRARSLGYKAKKGFLVIRVKLIRGGHKRPMIKKGRRSANKSQKLTLRKNYKQIAEERAQKTFLNLVVLNSYWVMRDGRFNWYEVIMVDPASKVIQSDNNINWICEKKHATRVFHGITSAGRKSRGLRSKSPKYASKARPSRRANKRL